MAAMVLDDQDMKGIAGYAVIDAIRKTRHYVPPYVGFHNRPSLGGVLDRHYRRVELTQEAIAESRNSLFIELNSIEQFQLGIGMVGQPRSRTRRAASIT
jgi:hypothetical protein